MKPKIEGFFEEFRFLSNFYPSEIFTSGLLWPTVEHAYQAHKTFNMAERRKISKLATPGQAKKAGQKLELREDWERSKVAVMGILLERKFERPELRKALIETFPFELEETNTWGDTFWGVCNGVGENHLGKLLMKIRGKLMEQEEEKRMSL